ncbi:MAG TPA: hypothetical protein VK718_03500 [Ferruginibacter sp.]|jgi:hypothetical protein|nr:hypothetical protein [Ferruginibacter sp.]
MKKTLLSIIVALTAIVTISSGCYEDRYYHRYHHHSGRYYHHHHMPPPAGVDIDIR